MAALEAFFATAGAALLVALLPLILFLVALWRIGTGAQQTASATQNLATAQLRVAAELSALGRIARAAERELGNDPVEPTEPSPELAAQRWSPVEQPAPPAASQSNGSKLALVVALLLGGGLLVFAILSWLL